MQTDQLAHMRAIKRTGTRLGLAIILAVGVGSCDFPEKDIAEVKKIDQSGYSPDFWLEKQSIFMPGMWDRVGLIFGMSNDYKACQDIVSALQRTVPQEQWRCVPAN